MSNKTPSPQGTRRSGRVRPTDSEVATFLREHPDFLLTHPELAEVLAAPSRPDGMGKVLDLQHFMVRRLQDEVQRLNRHQRELIGAARNNISIQNQVHEAALLMLEAGNFEHLIHVVTTDLPAVLNVDAVTLCVEASEEESPRRAKTAGVFLLPEGSIDSLIGAEREVLLVSDASGPDAVFGPAARLVRSQALVRLKSSPVAPAGLLALGSRQADQFHTGQGTELLHFLAQVLERLIRGWLNLPR